MKKYLLVLAIYLLTFTVGHCQTNVYYPFPETNAHWTETAWWIASINPPCSVTDEYSLFINGDTIIGSFTYHKIYKTGYISSNCPPPGYHYFNYYKGALRQDSLLKKVFFVPATNSNESLLYDFNLNVGDTLPLSYNHGNQNSVVGIDSVLVGGVFHKRFLLIPINGSGQPDTAYALIEGVGSTFGLYNLIYPPFESGSLLNCFGHSGQYYPTNSNCTFNVGLPKTDNQNFEIQIFPNPFSLNTTIQIDKIFNDATLTVYNSFGLQVKQVQNISGPTVKLNRDNLPSGLYFIRLTQDNIISTVKLIIAD